MNVMHSLPSDADAIAKQKPFTFERASASTAALSPSERAPGRFIAAAAATAAGFSARHARRMR
jgi:hypothetical protein